MMDRYMNQLGEALARGWILEIRASTLSDGAVRFYGLLRAPADKVGPQGLPYAATALGGAVTVLGLVLEALREIQEAESYPPAKP